MRSIRRGERGPAVVEIRSILVTLGLLHPAEESDLRPSPSSMLSGSSSNSVGSPSTVRWATRPGAHSTPPAGPSGARTLDFSVNNPLHGDDVRHLQERLLEMGYDVGRTDGVYGPRTARAVAAFQREVGLYPDGGCGPQTLHALRRLGRKVVGGSPLRLREEHHFRQSGPSLVGRLIVIDPGHGGQDPGIVVPDGPLRWTESDIAFDLASRLEGRLAAAGMRVHLTRGPAGARGALRPGPGSLANDLAGRPADLDPRRRPPPTRGRRRRRLPLRHRERCHLDDGGAAGRAGAARDRRPHRDAQLPDARQDVGAAALHPDARRPSATSAT